MENSPNETGKFFMLIKPAALIIDKSGLVNNGLQVMLLGLKRILTRLHTEINIREKLETTTVKLYCLIRFVAIYET